MAVAAVVAVELLEAQPDQAVAAQEPRQQETAAQRTLVVAVVADIPQAGVPAAPVS